MIVDPQQVLDVPWDALLRRPSTIYRQIAIKENEPLASPTIKLYASNEVPPRHKVTLVSVVGNDFTPCGHATITIRLGGRVLQHVTTGVDQSGSFRWDSSLAPQLSCDSEPLAVAQDFGSGLDSNEDMATPYCP
jgi:hypothetical protein